MALFRVYPSKDTTIANMDGITDISASNMGASEILNLYRTVEGATTANILIAFDTSSVPSTGTSSSSWTLHLRDAQHSDLLPFGYTASVSPLEQDWDEGRGHDLDFFLDTGAANWTASNASTSWATPGAIPTGTTSATFFFQTGHEDLDVNVSSLAAPYGYIVRVATSGVDLFIKKFHSRQTHFPARRPYLELRWSDWTGSLSTTTYWQASSGPWSGSYLDTRLSSTMSGASVVVTNSVADPTGSLVLSLYDMRPVFESSEIVTLHLLVRPKDYDPATVHSASLATSGTVLTNAFYRVVDAVTEDVLVPFGSGAIPYTKLSYNDLGNYFKFYMSTLPTGNMCRFDFAYQVGSDTFLVRGDDFTFRVR